MKNVSFNKKRPIDEIMASTFSSDTKKKEKNGIINLLTTSAESSRENKKKVHPFNLPPSLPLSTDIKVPLSDRAFNTAIYKLPESLHSVRTKLGTLVKTLAKESVEGIRNITNDQILLKINEYKDLYEFAEIIPLSALKDDNIDRLISVLKKYLPDNVKYFMDDEKTTQELDFRLSEIVREKIFIHTNEEVPHSISCKLVGYEENSKIAKVYIDIIVDRDSLRKIIIGANGNMIKLIGREARIDMEGILGKKVYLELYCKTIKKWREKEKYIKDLGYLLNNE